MLLHWSSVLQGASEEQVCISAFILDLGQLNRTEKVLQWCKVVVQSPKFSVCLSNIKKENWGSISYVRKMEEMYSLNIKGMKIIPTPHPTPDNYLWVPRTLVILLHSMLPNHLNWASSRLRKGEKLGCRSKEGKSKPTYLSMKETPGLAVHMPQWLWKPRVQTWDKHQTQS